RWEALDGVDLQDELRHPVPTLQDVPPFLRAAVVSVHTGATNPRNACWMSGESWRTQGAGNIVVIDAASY
ncbi:unnamed protein product, partial [Symbiodinium sp. CCMP2456]